VSFFPSKLCHWIVGIGQGGDNLTAGSLKKTTDDWLGRLLIQVAIMGYLIGTLWLCQQFAIENGHRNSVFSH
jgi:uncharacterized membrane protein AbrB (regulator of aidB expression)